MAALGRRGEGGSHACLHWVGEWRRCRHGCAEAKGGAAAEGDGGPKDDGDLIVATLELGSVVEIVGVKAKPELNGSFAHVVDYNQASERYTIEVERTRELFKLKEKNLRFTGEKCESTAEAARQKAEQRVIAAAAPPQQQSAPVVLFCQPIPLENLVMSVLSIAEYSTFSELMKMKVKQYQMIKKIEGDAQRLEDEKAARCIDLRDLAEGTALPARIVDLFQQARDRIIALTPSRRDLRDETSDSMSDDTWEELLRGGTASGPGKKAFQSLVDFVFLKRFSKLCSPADVGAITEEHRTLMDMSWASSFLPDIAHYFLKSAHSWLDHINDQIYEASRSMIQAQRKAVEAAKRDLSETKMMSSERDAKD